MRCDHHLLILAPQIVSFLNQASWNVILVWQNHTVYGSWWLRKTMLLFSLCYASFCFLETPWTLFSAIFPTCLLFIIVLQHSSKRRLHAPEPAAFGASGRGEALGKGTWHRQDLWWSPDVEIFRHHPRYGDGSIFKTQGTAEFRFSLVLTCEKKTIHFEGYRILTTAHMIYMLLTPILCRATPTRSEWIWGVWSEACHVDGVMYTLASSIP